MEDRREREADQSSGEGPAENDDEGVEVGEHPHVAA
jgi:hypothetical protein